MKQIYITFIALIFSATLFAQGIAVQGIARSNVNAAIVDTDLEFTFEIVSTANVILFAETEQIRTDGFGVFSHIISSGSATVNTFNSVDFSLQGLRARVFIDLNGKTEVYDQPFQYTPYAHYSKKAANGVPTGSIMAYAGTTAPEGWLLCDGSNIPSGSAYDALRTLMSTLPNAGKTPNLRGRFLRGAGTGGGHNAIITSQFDQTTLGQYQNQSMQDHRHSSGDLGTAVDGDHSHRLWTDGDRGGATTTDRNLVVTKKGRPNDPVAFNTTTYPTHYTRNEGEHSHTIIGNTSNAIKKSSAAPTQPLFLSTEETKPYNFSVNYIIKL